MAGLNTRKYQEKKIIIRNKTNQRLPLSRARIERVAIRVLESLSASRQWAIGISFLSDRQIQLLNQIYLKHNRPTDVLSFNYLEHSADIAISLDTAKRNAKVYSTSYKDELLLYIIHGFLHIFGYDDAQREAKTRMFRKQAEIFRKIAVLS